MSVSQDNLGQYQYTYNAEFNVAYIKITDDVIDKTCAFGCILVDCNDCNEIVGVEILDADLEYFPVDAIAESMHLDNEQKARLEHVSQVIEEHCLEDGNC